MRPIAHLRYQGVRREADEVHLESDPDRTARLVFAWTIREGDVENTYTVDVRCDNAKTRGGVPTPKIKATTFSKPVLQAIAASATATAAENQHVIEAGAKLVCRCLAVLQGHAIIVNPKRYITRFALRSHGTKRNARLQKRFCPELRSLALLGRWAGPLAPSTASWK